MLKRTTADGYHSGACEDTLETPFANIVAALGEPHRTKDADYPDDDYKTDVCWCVTDGTNYVSIWNYKNGPNYLRDDSTIESIDYFSVGYTSISFWMQIRDAILEPEVVISGL